MFHVALEITNSVFLWKVFKILPWHSQLELDSAQNRVDSHRYVAAWVMTQFPLMHVWLDPAGIQWSEPEQQGPELLPEPMWGRGVTVKQ